MRELFVTFRREVFMPLEPLAAQHLAWMRLSNKRPRTIYARERVLARLTAWAQSPVLYLTEQQLTEYQQWRATDNDAGKALGPTSMRVEVSHLRGFYNWVAEQGYRTDDPTRRLVMPKRKDYAAHPLPDEMIAKALAVADPDMHVILCLAGFAGLRACEIAPLDWRDVHIGRPDPYLHVRDGKGGYTRNVHLSEPVVAALEALPHRSGPVIVRADGKDGPNSAARISQRAADLLHELGTEKGETLHSLRHRFGTTAYEESLDLRAVQEEMGHRSIATTQIYTRVRDQARARATSAAGRLRLEGSPDTAA